MPVDNPEMQAVAISAGGGIVGSAVVALSKPMTRKEICYTMLGGTGTAAFLSPMLTTYMGWPWFFAGSLGMLCGLSVIGLIPMIQNSVVKVCEWFIKSKFPGPGGDTRDGGK